MASDDAGLDASAALRIPARAQAALPVTVIGGYLGAGKTSLVNHLLRSSGGRRIAVLVNDFGEMPIDADLIENIDGNVIGIAGGCVCCSYGSDLIGALEELASSPARPDHVLIETSGVALPGAVASAVSLVGGYTLDGVLVLADAETVRDRAADRYMADTVLRQLAEADLIALNKVDLIQPAEVAETIRWLAGAAAGKPVIATREARLPAAVAFGPRAAAEPATGSRHEDHAHELHDTSGFASAAFTIAHALDAPALARGLVALAPALLRAKGLVRGAAGATLEVQVVGGRWRVRGATGSGAEPGRLVIIGRAGDLPEAAVAGLLERCRV